MLVNNNNKKSPTGSAYFLRFFLRFKNGFKEIKKLGNFEQQQKIFNYKKRWRYIKNRSNEDALGLSVQWFTKFYTYETCTMYMS